jgi:membrane fusion protein (multidrug efflux system)
MKFVLKLSLPMLLALTPCACQKKPIAVAAGGFPATQVVAVEAKRQPVSETLSLVGTIAPNEMVEIKSEMDGTIAEIPFKEGDRVEAGRLLIRLDDSKLAAIVAEAEANFQLSRSNNERAKLLSASGLATPQDLDNAAAQFQAMQAALELKKRELKDARILAPFAGVIGARSISPGQVISRNTTLIQLVDLDPVKVEVNVPERYLSQLSLGQSLEFGVAAFPNDRFKGDVYFVSPQLDAATRTALVKARIPNPELKLKGGMFANLVLTLMLRESAIVVPEPALVASGDSVTVFVVDDKGTAQVRPVKIGLRLAGRAEVLSGLQPGEKVVVEGVQKLFPGAPVREAQGEAVAPYLN